MSPVPVSFVLPDLVASCPINGKTNPHYETGAAESRAWINSYDVFTDRKRAFFIQGSNELLVSHTYPYAGFDEFRTVCDFVNTLFVVDEVSDDQNGKDANATGNCVINAIKYPEWNDQSILTKITREFWARFQRTAGPKSTRRFIKHWEDYANCVVREAELREQGHVLDLQSFQELRRENSAIRLCFGLIEFSCGIDLPDYVFENAAFMDIYWAAADHVCWANDVYSYNMEQAKGLAGNNIITVLMKAKNMNLQEASDHVGVHCQNLVDTFISAQARLPSWGPAIDAGVARYINGLGHWMKGNLDWSFETQRYFGASHLEVKNTLVVKLRPNSAPEDVDSDSDSE